MKSYFFAFILIFSVVSNASRDCKNIKTEFNHSLVIKDKSIMFNGKIVESDNSDLLTVKRDNNKRPLSVRINNGGATYSFSHKDGKCSIDREAVYDKFIKYDKNFCNNLSNNFNELNRQCGDTINKIKGLISNFRQALKKEDPESDLYYFGLDNVSHGSHDLDKEFLNQRLVMTTAECFKASFDGELKVERLPPHVEKKMTPKIVR